jgi:hypothetical protein
VCACRGQSDMAELHGVIELAVADSGGAAAPRAAADAPAASPGRAQAQPAAPPSARALPGAGEPLARVAAVEADVARVTKRVACLETDMVEVRAAPRGRSRVGQIKPTSARLIKCGLPGDKRSRGMRSRSPMGVGQVG